FAVARRCTQPGRPLLRIHRRRPGPPAARMAAPAPEHRSGPNHAPLRTIGRPALVLGRLAALRRDRRPARRIGPAHGPGRRLLLVPLPVRRPPLAQRPLAAPNPPVL